MKKLVLTLLLTIPHVAWGSQYDRVSFNRAQDLGQFRGVAPSRTPSWKEVDKHTHLEDTVVLFQRIDTRKREREQNELRIGFNLKDTPHFDKYFYAHFDEGWPFVAIDSTHLCIACLDDSLVESLQEDAEAGVAFYLLKKEDGSRIKANGIDIFYKTRDPGYLDDALKEDQEKRLNSNIESISNLLLREMNSELCNSDDETSASESIRVVADKIAKAFFRKPYEELTSTATEDE